MRREQVKDAPNDPRHIELFFSFLPIHNASILSTMSASLLATVDYVLSVNKKTWVQTKSKSPHHFLAYIISSSSLFLPFLQTCFSFIPVRILPLLVRASGQLFPPRQLAGRVHATSFPLSRPDPPFLSLYCRENGREAVYAISYRCRAGSWLAGVKGRAAKFLVVRVMEDESFRLYISTVALGPKDFVGILQKHCITKRNTQSTSSQVNKYSALKRHPGNAKKKKQPWFV
ncbi:hypothetical protein J3E69DRAFT_331494 [Trichoderma sp. SZMC 28015]